MYTVLMPTLSKTGQLRDLEGRQKLLLRLVELSVTLNSTLDLDELLQLITATATELLECEAASILLYDEKNPRLYFAAATGSDPAQLAEIPVPIDSSLAGTIFRTNQPLILNDAQQDPRHYSLVSDHVKFKINSLLGVPMPIKDRTMGVLEAVNKREGGFTEGDAAILSVTAAHAAIAINNARLLRATQAGVGEGQSNKSDQKQFSFAGIPRTADSAGHHHRVCNIPAGERQGRINGACQPGAWCGFTNALAPRPNE